MTQRDHGAATGVFAPRLAEISAARDFVRLALIDAAAASRLGDAVLMASELVTNAVTYGRCDLAVTVVASPATVRVEVGHANQDRSTPHLVAPGAHGIGGQGLNIVDQLAARWGTEREHHGSHASASSSPCRRRDARPRSVGRTHTGTFGDGGCVAGHGGSAAGRRWLRSG